jgi:hypothetical protein
MTFRRNRYVSLPEDSSILGHPLYGSDCCQVINLASSVQRGCHTDPKAGRRPLPRRDHSQRLHDGFYPPTPLEAVAAGRPISRSAH